MESEEERKRDRSFLILLFILVIIVIIFSTTAYWLDSHSSVNISYTCLDPISYAIPLLIFIFIGFFLGYTFKWHLTHETEEEKKRVVRYGLFVPISTAIGALIISFIMRTFFEDLSRREYDCLEMIFIFILAIILTLAVFKILGINLIKEILYKSDDEAKSEKKK